MYGYDRIPGLKRILIEEAIATTSGSPVAPRVTGKLPGLESENLEWRLVAIEQRMNASSVTTGGAVTAANMTRPWSPVTIGINGWAEPAYNTARGDAIYRMILTQFGRPLGQPPVITAAITTAAIRGRIIYPFARVVGNTWYDSAPRADLISQLTVTRDDAGLPGGASFVAAPTLDFYAWVAPCSKVGSVVIPFSFSTWAAPSDLEMVIPAADRLHFAMATDTDDALTNTAQLIQLRVSGRPLLDVPVPLNMLTSDWNRTCLETGFRAPDAILETVAATGAAASPEWLPVFWAAREGRNYLKALSLALGGSASFDSDLGTTIHYSALRSWDPVPFGAVEARYLASVGHRGPVRSRVPTSKKDGHRPGLPYIVQG